MAQEIGEKILRPGEVLDDLQLDNLKIIQNRSLYCFTSDSVLLANFVKVGAKDVILELCSGCGVVSILVKAKCNPKKIFGIEIDKELHDMSVRSLAYNYIKDVEFVCDDAKNVLGHFKKQSFDVVFSNPPYFVKNKDDKINLKYLNAKYETKIDLEGIFKSADEMLKFGGKFFVCFTPTRVQELLAVGDKHKFVLKKMQFVYPKNKDKLSTLVLCCFVKNGNRDCEVVCPKYV